MEEIPEVGETIHQDGQPYWRRNLTVLWFSQFVSLCGFSMSVPFAPYFLRELSEGASESRVRLYAGLSSLLTQLAFAIMAPVWGMLADRFGRKRMVLRAAGMGAVVLGCMGLCQEVWQFLALRFLQGCFTGTIAASTTLVACCAPQKRQGYALGILSSSVYSGDMAGLLLGGVLAGRFGFRNSFHISCGLLMVTTLLVLFLVREDFTPLRKMVDTTVQKAANSTTLRTTLAVVVLPALPVLLIYGCCSMGRLMDQSQIALYVELLNGGTGYPGRELYTGWIMGAGALGAVTAGFLLARFIDRHAARMATLMGLGAALAVLVMAALPFLVPSAPRVSLFGVGQATTWAVVAMVPLRFVMIFCGGGMEPICTAWIAKVTLPENRGAMFGYAQAVRSIGSGLGHLGACVVAPVLGVNAVYWVIPAAFLVMVAMVGAFKGCIQRRILEVQQAIG